MSFDRPSYYLTFGGALFPLAAGHEQWQTGIKFASTLDRTESDLLGALDTISLTDILADCTEFIKGSAGFGPNWSNVVSIDWAKLAVLGTDGHYAGAPVVVEQTGQVGGAGAYAFPPQLAVAVSFWSGDTFGRGNRGRMYLPPPNSYLNSLAVNDPRATVVEANLLRDSTKRWLNNVSGEVSTVGVPTSPMVMSSLGTGVSKVITKLSVGRVMDTMRSRRQALDESPVWTAL